MSLRVRRQAATGCCCRAMLPQEGMHWSAQLIYLAIHPRKAGKMKAPDNAWVQQYLTHWIMCLNRPVGGQVTASFMCIWWLRSHASMATNITMPPTTPICHVTSHEAAHMKPYPYAESRWEGVDHKGKGGRAHCRLQKFTTALPRERRRGRRGCGTILCV